MIQSGFKEANNIVKAIELDDEGNEVREVDIPCYVTPDNKLMVVCFTLNKEEIDELVKTGKLYIGQSIIPGGMLPIIHDSVLKSELIDVKPLNEN